jgi:hypothetical protein
LSLFADSLPMEGVRLLIACCASIFLAIFLFDWYLMVTGLVSRRNCRTGRTLYRKVQKKPQKSGSNNDFCGFFAWQTLLLFGIPPQRHAGVGRTETKGVADADIDRGFASLVRYIVKITDRIGIFIVDRGRRDLVIES